MVLLVHNQLAYSATVQGTCDSRKQCFYLHIQTDVYGLGENSLKAPTSVTCEQSLHSASNLVSGATCKPTFPSRCCTALFPWSQALGLRMFCLKIPDSCQFRVPLLAHGRPIYHHQDYIWQPSTSRRWLLAVNGLHASSFLGSFRLLTV